MDILIVANFCMDFSKNDNGRFSYLANELSKTHSVEIVTSDFYHITKMKRESVGATNYVVSLLPEPGYVRNISLKRFYSHWMWGREVKKYLASRDRPDVVYCAVPSLTGPFNVARYCKRNHIKFIIDIQDLWPEAFQMVFGVPIIGDLIFAPFKFIANQIYKCADEVVAVSDTYVDRAKMVNPAIKKGHCVFLGTKLDTFDEFVNAHDVKKNTSELVLGYCGTLGSSYDLTCVFDALVFLRKKGFCPPKFLIMGDGPRINEFREYAEKLELNCEFTGRLPYGDMCANLVLCDMVVNPITKGAAQSIINKHADYAACGLPVLNTQECIEYRKLVEQYHMGINCENGNAESLANAMIELIQSDELRYEMGKNARKCAEQKFDRKNSYAEICTVITEG